MARPVNEERDALILTQIEKGKSMREVAKLFNLSVSTVHDSYSRAKNKDVRLSTV